MTSSLYIPDILLFEYCYSTCFHYVHTDLPHRHYKRLLLFPCDEHHLPASHHTTASVHLCPHNIQKTVCYKYCPYIVIFDNPYSCFLLSFFQACILLCLILRAPVTPVPLTPSQRFHPLYYQPFPWHHCLLQ